VTKVQLKATDNKQLLAPDAGIACAVFGASGYSGVELAWLLHNHPQFYL